MSDKLRVDLTGNSSGFRQMLEQAKAQTRAFTNSTASEISKSWGGIGKSLVGGIAGLVGAGAIKATLQGVFRDAGNLKDLTEQFDVGADSIQKWEKALEKSGVSINQYFRSIETLRANRADARAGGKNKFSPLGLGAEAIGTDVNDEELLKRVLSSGGSRSAINDALGRGGAKMKNALADVDSASTVYSQTDLERLNKIEQSGKRFWQTVKGVAATSVMGIAGLFDSQVWSERILISTEKRDAIDRLKAKLKQQQDKKDAQREKEEAGRAVNEKRALEQWKTSKEYRDKMSDEIDRLRNARRGTMSGDARRQDIRKELDEVRAKLKLLSGSEWELTTTESSKKRDLQTREAELMATLRGNQKPLNFQADSLAKVGLFTSSTVAYSPLLNIQQQQLIQLRRIADNTGRNGGYE